MMADLLETSGHHHDPATLTRKRGRWTLFLEAIGGPRKLPQAILVYLLLTFLSVVFLFPVLWIVGMSFKTTSQMFNNPPLFIWTPTLDNYRAVLDFSDGVMNSPFLVSFGNSLLVACGAVLVSIVFGTLASYAFSRYRFPGSASMMFSLLLMRMLPPIAVIVPMFSLFQKYGLIDTYPGIILPLATFSVPIVIWILRDFFDQFPHELEESASIDGATRWQILWHVVLPTSKSALVAAVIMALLFAWNDFLFAAVLTGTTTRTLPVLMAGYAGDTGTNWGSMTASGVLVILPVLVFSFFAQKQLASGVLSGSVKQ
jgi:ABC-type glycerol-3-phosphate transport system permease component